METLFVCEVLFKSPMDYDEEKDVFELGKYFKVICGSTEDTINKSIVKKKKMVVNMWSCGFILNYVNKL